MRLLFIGDVIGRAGRAAIAEHVPALRRQLALDFVVANGENAAGGFGITETIAQEFLNNGVDCVTLGNHSFDQREALVFIERAPHVLRPMNYPSGTPGRGAWLYETAKGERVLVMSVMGRVFMDALDDPFAAVEKELVACPLGLACDAAILDIHAEASSEKQAMAHFCDGRISMAVGSHTHVPDRRLAHPDPRHGVPERRRHDRRLQFRHRHGQGRADPPLHPQDAGLAL